MCAGLGGRVPQVWQCGLPELYLKSPTFGDFEGSSSKTMSNLHEVAARSINCCYEVLYTGRRVRRIYVDGSSPWLTVLTVVTVLSSSRPKTWHAHPVLARMGCGSVSLADKHYVQLT